MSRKELGLVAVFGAPAVIFVLSLIGLIGALVAEGVQDLFYSALLGSTVVVTVWALIRRRR